MNNVWDRIDSACYAKVEPEDPEDQYDCTFVLVAPKNAAANKAFLPRQTSRELGEGPARILYQSHQEPSSSQVTKESQEQASCWVKAPPSSGFHLRMRFNPYANPFTDDDARQTSDSSFPPPRSLISLTSPYASDAPPTPCTPRACMDSDPKIPPPCRPRHDLGLGENIPKITLLPDLL